MTSHILWQGIAVGFLAAVPLGPMGMVCVQRTLAHGRRAGLVSASGLTVAASFWCVVAAQGLSAVASLVAGREAMATFALGGFLVLAGLIGLGKGRKQIQLPSCAARGTLVGHFVTSFLGVILNPITFVTMTAALAILGGVRQAAGIENMAWLAVAVCVGGMMVWLAITHGVTVMRDRLGESGGVRINQVLNSCILLLGLVYLVRPLLPHMMG